MQPGQMKVGQRPREGRLKMGRVTVNLMCPWCCKRKKRESRQKQYRAAVSHLSTGTNCESNKLYDDGTERVGIGHVYGLGDH